MKRIILEVLITAAFVFIPTFFFYRQLAPIAQFWNAQFAWSAVLVFLWIIVATGYYHQGLLVRKKRHARSVSLMLPIAVFFVQCVLFILFF